ncbi:MAG TPA: hypothetical protein VIM79_27420 [Niastella sp.]
MKRMLLFLISSFLTVSVLQAQKPEVITNNKAGWHKIGDAKVDFKADKDKFVLIGKDKFKSLQLKVKDAPVHIESMTVEYEGNTKQDIDLKSAYQPDTESKVIELNHSNSQIRNVTFFYHTVPNTSSKKAEIELWGLK